MSVMSHQDLWQLAVTGPDVALVWRTAEEAYTRALTARASLLKKPEARLRLLQLHHCWFSSCAPSSAVSLSTASSASSTSSSSSSASSASSVPSSASSPHSCPSTSSGNPSPSTSSTSTASSSVCSTVPPAPCSEASVSACPGCLRAQVESARSLSTAQLGTLVEWKQLRGQWRPRNLALALGNSEESVRTATSAALGSIEKYADSIASPSSAESSVASATLLRAALREVTSLRGVGPATASAVLSALYPQAVAYMGDEALSAVLKGAPLRYSEADFVRYSAELHARCELLNAHLGSDDRRFGAADLERALFAAHRLPQTDELFALLGAHSSRSTSVSSATRSTRTSGASPQSRLDAVERRKPKALEKRSATAPVPVEQDTTRKRSRASLRRSDTP